MLNKQNLFIAALVVVGLISAISLHLVIKTQSAIKSIRETEMENTVVKVINEMIQAQQDQARQQAEQYEQMRQQQQQSEPTPEPKNPTKPTP